MHYTHTHRDTAPPHKVDIMLTLLTPRAPFYISDAANDSFRELVVVLAVRGGVTGRWNRNIGHERLVLEPHAYSVQPPLGQCHDHATVTFTMHCQQAAEQESVIARLEGQIASAITREARTCDTLTLNTISPWILESDPVQLSRLLRATPSRAQA